VDESVIFVHVDIQKSGADNSSLRNAEKWVCREQIIGLVQVCVCGWGVLIFVAAAAARGGS